MLPSQTPKTEATWISVHRDPSAEPEEESLDRSFISSTWDRICAEGSPTLSEVDKLAEDFSVLSGKWLVFISSDEVDELWKQIVKSTLAGTLGTRAKVSPRNWNKLGSKHLICIYNDDFRSMEDVSRVRDELRRLGVKDRISYKPDIYTYCAIYKGNKWGIPASLYNF